MNSNHPCAYCTEMSSAHAQCTRVQFECIKSNTILNMCILDIQLKKKIEFATEICTLKIKLHIDLFFEKWMAGAVPSDFPKIYTQNSIYYILYILQTTKNIWFFINTEIKEKKIIRAVFDKRRKKTLKTP